MTKVVILAGGFGTRISEYTKTMPKPMITINKKPILVHIMEHYVRHGFKNFYIAIGYKGSVIKKYFKKKKFNWNINLVDTGLKTMTGGRLKKLKKILGKDTFLMTYGDGLSNVNLTKLLKFHIRRKKLVTLTAVRPPARFGAIKLVGNNVKIFKEKEIIDDAWINGGFFVMEPKFLNYIKNENTFLEKEPLEKISKEGQLSAFKHYDFWQCMDTKRDRDKLEKTLKYKKFE
jgi:glucose-1-phosphate cytidylyltransferase